MPDLYGFISAKIAGVTPDKVTLRVMKTGGGFGRRAVADGDVVSEAVAVSKALGGKPSECNGRARTTCAVGAIAGLCASTEGWP